MGDIVWRVLGGPYQGKFPASFRKSLRPRGMYKVYQQIPSLGRIVPDGEHYVSTVYYTVLTPEDISGNILLNSKYNPKGAYFQMHPLGSKYHP